MILIQLKNEKILNRDEEIRSLTQSSSYGFRSPYANLGFIDIYSVSNRKNYNFEIMTDYFMTLCLYGNNQKKIFELT